MPLTDTEHNQLATIEETENPNEWTTLEEEDFDTLLAMIGRSKEEKKKTTKKKKKKKKKKEKKKKKDDSTSSIKLQEKAEKKKKSKKKKKKKKKSKKKKSSSAKSIEKSTSTLNTDEEDDSDDSISAQEMEQTTIKVKSKATRRSSRSEDRRLPFKKPGAKKSRRGRRKPKAKEETDQQEGPTQTKKRAPSLDDWNIGSHLDALDPNDCEMTAFTGFTGNSELLKQAKEANGIYEDLSGSDSSAVYTDGSDYDESSSSEDEWNNLRNFDDSSDEDSSIYSSEDDSSVYSTD